MVPTRALGYVTQVHNGRIKIKYYDDELIKKP